MYGPAGARLAGFRRTRTARTLINVIPGDFEPDGDVDFEDLCVLTAHWLESNQPGCIGDLDGDCDVDLRDLAILAQNWGVE